MFDCVFVYFPFDFRGLQQGPSPACQARSHQLFHLYCTCIFSLQNLGSQLLVLRGQPEEVLPRVLRDWSIQKLCYEVRVNQLHVCGHVCESHGMGK